MTRRVRFTVSLFACSLLLISRASSASNLDTFGATPEDIAHVGARVAGASNGTAAFYNPSGLAFGRRHEIQISSLGHLSLLTRQGRRAPLAAPPAATLALSLPSPWHALRLGLLVQSPGNKPLSLQAPSVSQPLFPAYAYRLDRLVLLPAISLRWKNWAAGLALNTMAGINANLDIAEDSSRTPSSTMSQASPPIGSPIVGLSWRPSPRLGVGIVYRHAFSIPMRVRSTVDMAGVQLRNNVHVTDLMFEPSTLAAGLRWIPGQTSVEIDISYRRWSTWSGPWLDMTTDVSALSLRRVQLPDLFQDTWGVRVSLTRTIHRTHSRHVDLLGGFGYESSMLRDVRQGQTNLLDAPTWTTGVGARARWEHVAGLSLGTSIALQLKNMQGYAQDKRLCTEAPCGPDQVPAKISQTPPKTDNPGYPTLLGGGSVIVIACGMEAQW